MPGSTIAEIASAPAANAYSAVPMPLTSADKRSAESPTTSTRPPRNGSQFSRNAPSTAPLLAHDQRNGNEHKAEKQRAELIIAVRKRACQHRNGQRYADGPARRQLQQIAQAAQPLLLCSVTS